MRVISIALVTVALASLLCATTGSPNDDDIHQHIEQELQERDKISVIADSAFELRIGSNPGWYLQTHALDKRQSVQGRHFEDAFETIAAPEKKAHPWT